MTLEERIKEKDFADCGLLLQVAETQSRGLISGVKRQNGLLIFTCSRAMTSRDRGPWVPDNGLRIECAAGREFYDMGEGCIYFEAGRGKRCTIYPVGHRTLTNFLNPDGVSPSAQLQAT
jgi:hypothetical protein